MNDPYKVLGVSPSASDDEIKQAYRKLAKQYHPDKYADNPLSELATEKMKQINEAYDMIINERKREKREGRQNTSGSTANNGGSTGARSGGRLYEIRSMINSGNYAAAEQALVSISSNERDAEWYYLMGVVVYQKGWLEDAYNYFETACRMAPDDVEYRSLYNRVREQRSGTQGGYNAAGGAAPCGCCDICTCLICSDCLCGLCGR